MTDQELATQYAVDRGGHMLRPGSVVTFNGADWTIESIHRDVPYEHVEGRTDYVRDPFLTVSRPVSEWQREYGVGDPDGRFRTQVDAWGVYLAGHPPIRVLL